MSLPKFTARDFKRQRNSFALKDVNKWGANVGENIYNCNHCMERNLCKIWEVFFEIHIFWGYQKFEQHLFTLFYIIHKTTITTVHVVVFSVQHSTDFISRGPCLVYQTFFKEALLSAEAATSIRRHLLNMILQLCPVDLSEFPYQSEHWNSWGW